MADFVSPVSDTLTDDHVELSPVLVKYILPPHPVNEESQLSIFEGIQTFGKTLTRKCEVANRKRHAIDKRRRPFCHLYLFPLESSHHQNLYSC